MENEIHYFVTDCLANPGNREKQQELAQWLNAAPENRLLFREIQQVWEAAGDLPAEPFDQAAGWQALAQHIGQAPAVAPAARVLRMPGWRQVAAILLPLLLAAGYYWYKHAGGSEWTTYIAKVNDKNSLVLPDGSNIFLQPGTELAYQKDFKERRILLKKGEAFFKVEEDAQHTFSIQAANATIKVLGTAFNVKITAAYTAVSVWEGKVSLDAAGFPQTILTAGEMGFVNTATGQVRKTAGDQGSGTNNELAFSNQPVEVVIRTLAAYYHVQLQVQDTAVLNKHITIRFSNMPLKEALVVLAEMLDLEIKQSSDTTYLLEKKK